MDPSLDYTYHSAGKTNSSTRLVRDSEVLEEKKQNPKKITAIIVYWNDHLCGFEAFYDGKSAGPRIGNDYNNGVVHSRMDFADDQYITELSGKSGDSLEHLVVQTSNGRSLAFGSPENGDHFSLKEEGKVVKNFDIAFYDSLNLIGANFGAPDDIFTLSRDVGSFHSGSTQTFDDLESKLKGRSGVEISSIDVLHDKNMVVGIEVIYKLDGLYKETSSHLGKNYNPSTTRKTIEVGNSKAQYSSA